MPEFSPQALDSLRQPLETGEVMVARANYHVRTSSAFFVSNAGKCSTSLTSVVQVLC